MKYVIAVSGPVASGKSAIVAEIMARFGAERISTSRILLDRGTANRRDALIEAGKDLDRTTGGKWVSDGVASYAIAADSPPLIIIDAVRTSDQVRFLRQRFGQAFLHVHIAVPFEVARERYSARGAAGDRHVSYDEVKADPTESGVWLLDRIADRVVENHLAGPASAAARALAGLGLFPLQPDKSVDVLIGGQYGSEGKGNICAHLAEGYDFLMRVGGPNAGHMVAFPEYKYIQLPSGTQSNNRATILIGAGATIIPQTILREISECGAAGRIVIDEQAMIIEPSDQAFEEKTLDVIASTKQGVGAATARKILGRDDEEHLGAKVRLAKNHPDLKPYIGSVARALEDAYAAGKRIMLEGTQGTGLSLHHASYPHVTSRETTASGCLADAGIAPNRVQRVVMVTRTYPIRVGGSSGPMDRPIEAAVIAERSGLPLSQIEKTEVGTISGNRRRMAEFDWEQLRRSAVLNGATDIALTFADYIDAENQRAERYEQLSHETRAFIDEVERVANAPVSLISRRFDRFAVIDRRTWR